MEIGANRFVSFSVTALLIVGLPGHMGAAQDGAEVVYIKALCVPTSGSDGPYVAAQRSKSVEGVERALDEYATAAKWRRQSREAADCSPQGVAATISQEVESRRAVVLLTSVQLARMLTPRVKTLSVLNPVLVSKSVRVLSIFDLPSQGAVKVGYTGDLDEVKLESVLQDVFPAQKAVIEYFPDLNTLARALRNRGADVACFPDDDLGVSSKEFRDLVRMELRESLPAQSVNRLSEAAGSAFYISHFLDLGGMAPVVGMLRDEVTVGPMGDNPLRFLVVLTTHYDRFSPDLGLGKALANAYLLGAHLAAVRDPRSCDLPSALEFFTAHLVSAVLAQTSTEQKQSASDVTSCSVWAQYRLLEAVGVPVLTRVSQRLADRIPGRDKRCKAVVQSEKTSKQLEPKLKEEILREVPNRVKFTNDPGEQYKYAHEALDRAFAPSVARDQKLKELRKALPGCQITR